MKLIRDNLYALQTCYNYFVILRDRFSRNLYLFAPNFAQSETLTCQMLTNLHSSLESFPHRNVKLAKDSGTSPSLSNCIAVNSGTLGVEHSMKADRIKPKTAVVRTAQERSGSRRDPEQEQKAAQTRGRAYLFI